MAFACFGTAPGGRRTAKKATRAPPRRSRARRASPPSRRRPEPNEYSILVDSDDSCAARLAGEFVAALQADGAKGRVIAGRTSPTALAKAVKSDGADLAIAPMDALIDDDKATADWRERAPYIARLGAETDRNRRAAGGRRRPPARRPRRRFRRRRRRGRGHRRDAVLAARRRAQTIVRAARTRARRSGGRQARRGRRGRGEILEDFGRLRQGRALPRRPDSVVAGAAAALRAGAIDGEGPAEPHRRGRKRSTRSARRWRSSRSTPRRPRRAPNNSRR